MKPSQINERQSRVAIEPAAARPPCHRDEERRGEEHPKREQRHRIDRIPRVGELDQDRLERKTQHAEDRAHGTDPRRVAPGQSHCTRPAYAVTRITAPKTIRYQANGMKS